MGRAQSIMSHLGPIQLTRNPSAVELMTGSSPWVALSQSAVPRWDRGLGAVSMVLCSDLLHWSCVGGRSAWWADLKVISVGMEELPG